MTNSPGSEWVPSACTLPTVDQPTRVAEFDTFFAREVRAVHRASVAQLNFVIAASAEQVGRDLAARESGCCSFFAFDFVGVDDESVVMSVRVPVSQVATLDALQTRALAASRAAGEQP